MTAQAIPASSPPTTRQGFRFTPSVMMWPALLYLILTTQAPFFLTIYYSFFQRNLQLPMESYPFVGLDNYIGLFKDPQNLSVIWNTLVLTGGVLIITLVLGGLLAMLLNRPFMGRALVRTILISSFLIMPVVTAVVWKNLLLNYDYGFFSWLIKAFGGSPVAWLTVHPMATVITMVSWEWTPFAMLILLTGLQSLPDDQIEAARLDGANPWQEFRHIVLPHWTQALEVVILLETLNVLQVYGEIAISTAGGPGVASTNLPYYISQKLLVEGNIGVGSAAGVVAVILTNLLAVFMLRLINRNTQVGGH
ncbi:sugar ABC transporter permease (plasmid) [Deinococcus sp. KNUC1210]|uniref:carbohydrate ABC transporter permease n=1 Tax=Deinococcus sp. KNUC1210 TaxID=2917691 RepID=UPI001EEFE892|nr:sugar ABC transporter permease [Deinococcus sp. KNUC1210]ULH13825.1 sugar ABC transporter permease [Deinococcus sp. KNUC1210]ULH14194.1 sugar ABC transporter permease [Deinococcus sp. KNUC1210]